MKSTPPLHLIQIVSALVIGVLAGVGYFFAPDARTEFFAVTATGATGFLFGKFTNNFGGRKNSEDQ